MSATTAFCLLLVGACATAAVAGLKDCCGMPAEKGLCLAYLPHYYYDADTQRCEQFVYGGCGGNCNRYESLQLCKAACYGAEWDDEDNNAVVVAAAASS